nr:hypothetical protein [Candidatus Freyarchaeota archaeon]
MDSFIGFVWCVRIVEGSELFEMLKRAVVDFDEKVASEVAAEIVEQGMDVTAGVEALRQGMVRVAEMYENKSPHGRSSKSTGRNRPQIQIRHLNGLRGTPNPPNKTRKHQSHDGNS